ncbi:hypothetical protein [Kitasatospora sp. NPDC088346]|uniref:hypothetical protein n=1 Tax=Kitasatospora sp. NPDC088346 TaxID=3364073 RepID=UPI00382C7497
MFRRWRSLTALVPAVLALGLLPVAGAGAAGAACEGQRPRVPGAERLVSHCLDDLTTAGLPAGLTDAEDTKGLQAVGTVNPSHVPGVQLDGYFPDTSTTNALHGWNHDSQFVIRLPEHWNGGLVVAGPPGTTAGRRPGRTPPVSPRPATWCAGSWSTSRSCTPAASTGTACCSPGTRPTC